MPSIRSQLSEGEHDIGGLRKHVVLQRWRVREWYIRGGHPQNWSVEPLEGALVDARGNLARNAASPSVLVHDQNAIGLLHCRDYRFVIHRQKRAQIDDLHR